MGGRLSAIGAAVRGVMFKAAVTISLIPPWMAGIAFQLFDSFGKLVSEGYKKNSVAYACIRLLSTSVGEPLLKVYRATTGGRLEEIADHPLRALLARPNPLMTEFELFELITIHLSICGRSYWWKERANNGALIGLWPLRPDRIEPILGPDTRNFLAGWRYWLDGQEYRLPARDVWHHGYPDPGDESGGILGGLGPMQVLAREIDTDNEATSFVYAMLRNYAMPGVVLTTKAKLNQKEADALKAGFLRKYGEMNRGTPAVVDGDTTITALAHNMRDMEFPDVRSLSEARIAAAFGVPAILVGLKVGLDRSTFSNMAEAREYLAETTLSVLWRRLADQVTADLLPEFGGAGLVAAFDTSTVRALAGQQKERAVRYEKAFARGGITLNMYLQHGLGLDTIPNGDVFYIPNSVTVVAIADLGKPPPEPKPVALPPPKADEEDEERPPPDRRKALSKAELQEIGRQVRAIKALPSARRRMEALAGPFAADLTAWFAGLGDRVIARLNERAGKGVKAANDDDWLTTADSESFTEAVSAGHAAAVERAGAVAATELAIEGSWSLPPTDALGLVDELATRIAGIDATTRQQVRDAIAAGLAEGEGVDDLARRIRALVDETWPNRARTIARTETGIAYNRGAILAYERSGLVDEVECLDGGDCGLTSHDDPDKANGTRRSLKVAAQYPICHPNCIRSWAPVVKE